MVRVVRRRSARLAAGALALVLPFAAVAGCGAEKRRTIEAELASAQNSFENSQAASFTLRLDDRNGNALKLASREADSAALAKALLGGSISYVVDPASDRTFKQLQAEGKSSTDLAAQLKSVNLAFVLRDANADLAEFRLVAGTLYARVDVKAISRLATAQGVEDVDALLDEGIATAPQDYRQALEDVRAGRWIKVELSTYIEQFQDLAEGFTGLTPPSPGAVDSEQLGKDLFAAIKPHVRVTDANNESADRVLDVKVSARPALKAALALLQASDSLPFAAVLADVTPADVDAAVADGTANGTITLKSGHLSQVTLDLESLRLLAVSADQETLAGAHLVVDVDDSAEQVKAPEDVSSFDVGALIDQLLQGFGPVGTGSSISGSFSG